MIWARLISTHESALRLSHPPDDLYSGHLLAILLFEELHREPLINLFSEVFSVLGPTSKDELIGSSTDDTPT